MANPETVEDTILDLMRRLERVDPNYRAVLPSRRTIEAECPDLDAVYHAYWRHGKMSELHPGPADRADIRIIIDSDDLMKLVKGELDFSRAYAANRIRVDASMTDLLRLRAVM